MMPSVDPYHVSIRESAHPKMHEVHSPTWKLPQSLQINETKSSKTEVLGAFSGLVENPLVGKKFKS